MDKDLKIMIFLVLLLSTIFGLTIYGLVRFSGERDRACAAIGFENYVHKTGQDYCEDSIGNLYYIKMNCGFMGRDCTSNEISIGEVRNSKLSSPGEKNGK